jgi:hypothetical protein
MIPYIWNGKQGSSVDPLVEYCGNVNFGCSATCDPQNHLDDGKDRA